MSVPAEGGSAPGIGIAVGDQPARVDRPIRVLFVIATFNIGGAERQLLELSSGLNKERFDCEVLAFREGPLLDEFKARGVNVTIIEKRGKIDLGLVKRVRRFIRAGNFDIMHTYMFTANTWARLAAGTVKRPAMIASERSVDTWKGGLHWAIDRYLAKRSRAVVANAATVGRYLVDRGGLPARLVRVIPNGIDLGNFQGAAAAPHAGSPFTVLCVGRLHPAKGQDVLLAAFHELLQASGDARLILVGDATIDVEKQFKEELLQDIASRGLSDKVHLAGFHSDTRPYLAKADVLAIPSYREGFPNVMVEALASGVPVVASRVGGVPDIATDEESALIVGPGDSGALAASLMRIAGDPDLARHLSENGKARAAEFTLSKMIAATEALYEEFS